MKQTLLLIRHGQTDYHQDRLAGWTPGVGLSEQGRTQVRSLAERLAPVRLVALYSSPLDRCRHTADEVAEGRRMDVRVEERLGEARFGRWEGKRYSDLRKTTLWRTVQTLPSQARFPDGESVLEMQSRAVEALEEIRSRHRAGFIAAVTHADVIKAVAAHYLGLHVDLFQRLDVVPASLTAIGFGDDFPRLLRLGDTGDYTPYVRKPRAAGKKGSRVR